MTWDFKRAICEEGMRDTAFADFFWKNTFELMDLDKSGTLEWEEFVNGLVGLPQVLLPEHKCKEFSANFLSPIFHLTNFDFH